jgi:RNA recognition motif-containing protein
VSRKLHVANLNASINDPELRRMFDKCGTVLSAEVVRSPMTGMSEGIGLVEMRLEKEGAVAIAMLHGHEHLGQLLAVQWATSRDQTDADHASMFGPMNIIDDADLTEI